MYRRGKIEQFLFLNPVFCQNSRALVSKRSSDVTQQAGKHGKERSWSVSAAGSAFVKVYFCISEHTEPRACSNSLQLMTTAQQQRCLISVFPLIWVVKVRLLEAVYFTSTEKTLFCLSSDND